MEEQTEHKNNDRLKNKRKGDKLWEEHVKEE